MQQLILMQGAPSCRKEDKIPPGEVVKLEVGIWPAAIQWEAGEKLVLRVLSYDMSLAEFPPL